MKFHPMQSDIDNTNYWKATVQGNLNSLLLIDVSTNLSSHWMWPHYNTIMLSIMLQLISNESIYNLQSIASIDILLYIFSLFSFKMARL